MLLVLCPKGAFLVFFFGIVLALCMEKRANLFNYGEINAPPIVNVPSKQGARTSFENVIPMSYTDIVAIDQTLTARDIH